MKYSNLFEADGKLVADSIPKQDMIGWVAQGPISDRTREHLTASDKGVILYHKLLNENMERVERGEDPMGIIRDPAENEPDRQPAPRVQRDARLRSASTATISRRFASSPISAAEVRRGMLTRATALRLFAAAGVALPATAAAQTGPLIRVGDRVGRRDVRRAALRRRLRHLRASAGLNVQLSEFPSAGPIAAALVGGSLDVGTGDVILLANAVNRGVPIVAIASSGLFRTTEPTSGLCVLKSSTVKTAKDFEGQTIAVGTLVSLTTISLRMWLSQNGASPDRVQFIEMRFPEMPAALERGTVAGAYMVEPNITQSSDKIKQIATPYGAIASSFPISAVLTSKAWLADNTDLARKFVDAIYATARWANANRTATAGILANYVKVDPDVIHRMHRTSFATSLDPAGFQAVLNAAAANKLIDRPTNAADLIARLG